MVRRIETIRGKRKNNSAPRSRDGGAPAPKATAEVSVVNGGAHVNYYFSVAACAVAETLPAGVKAVFDVDDTGQAVMHLIPAESRGFTLRKRPGQRPHFCIPTGDVGRPDAKVGVLYEAKELEIASDQISVQLPFTFLIEPEPEQLAEALEEQAEEPVEE